MADDPTNPGEDVDGDAIAVVTPKRKPDRKRGGKRIPRFNVVLWDSDDHTFEYVEEMLRELFGHTQEACHQLAETVDADGRAVVLTTTKEHAELKRDQIHAYGKDEEGTTGSMWATIEAAD
ncbi:MAG: ATP-dependent Clp protease adaptor ClpS [Planctomycetota bacterium]